MNANRVKWWISDRVDFAVARVASLAPERMRWSVATWVNDHLPNQCWTDLVTWAMRTPKDDPDWRSDIPSRPIGDMCRRDAQANGRCYCGKLAADGSVLLPGQKVPCPKDDSTGQCCHTAARQSCPIDGGAR